MKTPSRRTLTSAASARTAAAQPRRSCNSRRLPRPSASIGQLLELRFEWGTKILPKKSCAGRPSTTGISEPGTRLSSDEDRPTWPPLTTSSGDTVPRVRKQARSRGARYCFQESCPSGEQLSERRDGILTAIRGDRVGRRRPDRSLSRSFTNRTKNNHSGQLISSTSFGRIVAPPAHRSTKFRAETKLPAQIASSLLSGGGSILIPHAGTTLSVAPSKRRADARHLLGQPQQVLL